MAAEHALVRIRGFARYKRQDYRGPLPIRCYQCPVCHGWHLTADREETFDRKAEGMNRIERAAIRRVIALVEGLDLD